MRGAAARGLIIVAALGVAACGRSCSCGEPQTPEDRIAAVIGEIEDAAEEKDVGDILEHVSEAYKGRHAADKRTVKAILAQYFFRHPKIGVIRIGLDTEVGEDALSAHSVYKAALTSGEAEGKLTDVIPRNARGYLFEIDWRLEEGDWRVIAVEYRILTAGELL